jgi:hypothetical protein
MNSRQNRVYYLRLWKKEVLKGVDSFEKHYVYEQLYQIVNEIITFNREEDILVVISHGIDIIESSLKLFAAFLLKRNKLIYLGENLLILCTCVWISFKFHTFDLSSIYFQIFFGVKNIRFIEPIILKTFNWDIFKFMKPIDRI